MTNTKTKILIGVKQAGRIDRPRDLCGPAGTDEHNIIHLLHAMRKQGLISCRIDQRGKVKEPYRITLTKQGERAISGKR